MCSKLHFVEETIAVMEAKKLGTAGGTLPSTYCNKLELLHTHTHTWAISTFLSHMRTYKKRKKTKKKTLTLMVSLKHKSTSKIELLQQAVKSYCFVEFIQVCSFSDIIQYLQRLIITPWS